LIRYRVDHAYENSSTLQTSETAAKFVYSKRFCHILFITWKCVTAVNHFAVIQSSCRRVVIQYNRCFTRTQLWNPERRKATVRWFCHENW